MQILFPKTETPWIKEGEAVATLHGAGIVTKGKFPQTVVEGGFADDGQYYNPVGVLKEEDVDYIILSANHFHKAVQLIQRAKATMEREGITGVRVQSDIDTFLNQVEQDSIKASQK